MSSNPSRLTNPSLTASRPSGAGLGLGLGRASGRGQFLVG